MNKKNSSNQHKKVQINTKIVQINKIVQMNKKLVQMNLKIQINSRV